MNTPGKSAPPLPPIYVAGLGLPVQGRQLCIPAGLRPLIDRAEVLVGGKRLLAAFADHPAEKLAVGPDTEALYSRMGLLRERGKIQLALCSGDPLFFGLGARLAERFGASSVRVLPGVSSLQAAAALLGLPWETMAVVSLHGRRTVLPLAHALMRGGPVFVLCDQETSPAAIAAWMRERGCSGYRMHVVDNLYCTGEGEARAQRHVILRVKEAGETADAEQQESAAMPLQRILVLQPEHETERQAGSGGSVPGNRPFGLEDSSLDSQGGLLTRLPLRGAGLAALGVEPDSIVWDLGAGSGAISIEAARLAWRGQVLAVERHTERIALIRANRQRFCALNLEILQGMFPACLEELEKRAGGTRPHRIFVGGGLGGSPLLARALLESAWRALLPGGRLLAHCVLLSSLELARTVLRECGGSVHVRSIQAAEASPLAGDVQLKALNPVFLILAEKAPQEPL